MKRDYKSLLFRYLPPVACRPADCRVLLTEGSPVGHELVHALQAITNLPSTTSTTGAATIAAPPPMRSSKGQANFASIVMLQGAEAAQSRRDLCGELPAARQTACSPDSAGGGSTRRLPGGICSFPYVAVLSSCCGGDGHSSATRCPTPGACRAPPSRSCTPECYERGDQPGQTSPLHRYHLRAASDM